MESYIYRPLYIRAISVLIWEWKNILRYFNLITSVRDEGLLTGVNDVLSAQTNSPYWSRENNPEMMNDTPKIVPITSAGYLEKQLYEYFIASG